METGRITAGYISWHGENGIESSYFQQRRLEDWKLKKKKKKIIYLNSGLKKDMIEAASNPWDSDYTVLGPCRHTSATCVLTQTSLFPTQSPHALWNSCLFSWLMGMGKSQTTSVYVGISPLCNENAKSPIIFLWHFCTLLDFHSWHLLQLVLWTEKYLEIFIL